MDLMYELVMAFLVLCNIQVSTEDLLSTHLFQQQSPLHVQTITHCATWELTSANTAL